MAKSKTQSSKLPKHIAGVKVPKAMRETGGKFIDALRHPLIADFAAAALLAAAAALREDDDVRKAAGKAKDKALGSAAGAVSLAPILMTRRPASAKPATAAKKAKPKAKSRKK